MKTLSFPSQLTSQSSDLRTSEAEPKPDLTCDPDDGPVRGVQLQEGEGLGPAGGPHCRGHHCSTAALEHWSTGMIMIRLYSVKIWLSKNAFFILFFNGRAFIMVKNNIKLVLEFQFDLKNPLKQPEMWIFEKWKIIVFGQNYGIFWPKGDLKPCIIMYLGNIHNMSLVTVTFGNFFFQILQKWHYLG